MNGTLTSELLPACDRGLDVPRVEIHRVADAPGLLCGDHGGAAADERAVDGVTGSGVIEERGLEQRDGLLGGVTGGRVVGCTVAAHGVQIGNGPHRRLTAVAQPASPAANRVPTRLMLPVVVAAAQREVLLDPNDLAAD